MSKPATIDRFAVVLRPTAAHLRRTGTRPDAGPVLKMRGAVGELNEQFAESRKLEKGIRLNLEGLGYGG